MLTDTDTKKLITEFKKVFPTKESLKDELNDMRSQIIDSFDGKLKATERNILEAVDQKLTNQSKELLTAMDDKLAAQKDEIVKDVVAIVTPLFDEQDEKFLRSKPKN